MAYVVKTALVIAKGPSGDVYLYEGTVVPAHIAKDEVERLVEGGFVKSDETAPEPDAPTMERPNESGPGSTKDQWLAYAAHHEVEVDQGASREDIISAVTAAGH